MPVMASPEEIKEFTEKCLSILDKQVIPLESDEAKIAAIQAVRYVLQEYLLNDESQKLMRLLRYRKIGEYFRNQKQSLPPLGMSNL
ncbi:MAG: hypothetical protein BWY42_00942 [Candidatus Omnitrophica bacterium ADurb.Bin277]|nr:MAG: hypothetical protein BWY42_00942 [Candidatus Omnitrophica bacterium ADurb.Bin277]